MRRGLFPSVRGRYEIMHLFPYKVFQEYRREYKRHFAWIKAGKISEEQFADWAKRAKAKKKDCDAEKITLDEFKAWLKNS